MEIFICESNLSVMCFFAWALATERKWNWQQAEKRRLEFYSKFYFFYLSLLFLNIFIHSSKKIFFVNLLFLFACEGGIWNVFFFFFKYRFFLFFFQQIENDINREKTYKFIHKGTNKNEKAHTRRQEWGNK